MEADDYNLDLLECCDICGEDHYTIGCPELGLPDSQSQPQLATRARLTLPSNLQVVDDGQGHVGVVAMETIEKRTQFGPFEAKRTTHVFEDDGFFTLKLLGKDGNTVVLDTTDENECNWLCLIRSAMSEESQNCMAYQLGTNIFYSTTRQVEAGDELQVWYAPHFAKKLGKPSLPDPNYKVLLGHRIEPMPLKTAEDEAEETPFDYTDQEQSLPSDSNCQPTGELVKIHQCPRCPKEFRTQTDMVQHLRDHILPGSYKDKNSQTPRGRGRPRIYPKQEEVDSITPKRKRGRPKKGNTQSTVIADLTEEDSADESDDADEKRTRLDDIVQAETNVHLLTAVDIPLDKDYSPVAKLDTSTRRVQPKRTSRGQHSRYGKDFIVDKIRNPEIKKEANDDVKNENDHLDRNGSATQIEHQQEKRTSVTGRGRGRPRKYKMNNVKNVPKAGKESENDLTLSVKPPSKTYERRGNPTNLVESCSKKVFKGEFSDSCEVKENIHRMEKIVDGISIKVMVKQEDVNSLTDIEEISNAEQHNTSLVASEALNEADEKCQNGLVIDSRDTDLSIETSDNLVVNSATKSEADKKYTTFENHMGEMLNVVKTTSNEKDENTPMSSKDIVLEEKTKTDYECKDDAMGDLNNDSSARSEQALDLYKNEGTETSDIDIENYGTDEHFLNETFEIEEDNVESEKAENTENPDELGHKIIYVLEKDGTKYKCGICGKMFTKLNYLKLHLPKHTDKYKCQKCGKSFTRNDSLQKHKCEAVRKLLDQPLEETVIRREFEGKEYYQCAKCDESFDAQIEAIAHYMSHSSENLSCLKCNKTLQTGETLDDHKCTVEESDKKFVCDLCNQNFTSAKYLHRHLAMHTDLFECKKCKFCFSRKDSLHKHVLKCCPELAESYKMHYCSLCYRVFSTKSGKQNHASKCKWVRCEKCSKVFSSAEDMNSHDCFEEEKTTADSGIEFSCGKCGKTFLNNYYLKQHQAIHQETFQCNICMKFLKSQEDLSAHVNICEMVQQIRNLGQVECDLCSTVFTRAKDLRLHYNTHTHPYFCIKCEKRFVKESGLLVHSCKAFEGNFNCKECQKSFTSSRFLTRHVAVYHSKHVFKCNQCGKGFNRRLKYQNHVCKLEDGTYGNVNLKNGKYKILSKLVCHKCGKSFSSRSNLNKHIISHGEKQCRCSHCGKMFHFESYLREHIASVHLNLYKYQCTECGKLMKSKTGLVAHVKQFHIANTEVFTCEICGKCFKQKGNLNTHRYSHDPVKNFTCEFCRKAFKYPDQLARHKLIHTMVNKLKCSYCDKKFVKEYELKRHEMIFHSGLVYVCDVCAARCGHKHTLIRHYKRKHPELVDHLNMPSVLEGMLKRLEHFPDYETAETLEVEDNNEIEEEAPLVENISLMKENINIINGPVMPPQAAAEVLHSLSSAAAVIEPLSENRKAGLEPGLVPSESVRDEQTIQIQLQPSNDNQQGTIQIAQEHIITSDPSEIQFEVQLAETGENVLSTAQPAIEGKPAENTPENTITMDNGMININGQYIPISNLQAVPQDGDTGEGEGQIVILHIWDPQVEEQGTQEQLIQIQGEPGQ